MPRLEVAEGWNTEGTHRVCFRARGRVRLGDRSGDLGVLPPPPRPCLEPPPAIGMECGAIKEPWWVRWPGSMQWALVLVWEVPRPSLTRVPSTGDLVAEAAGAKPPPDSLMCSG